MKTLFRLVVVTAILFLMCSCGAVSRHVASFSGYSKVCVNGVEYLQFPSGVVVSYKYELLGEELMSTGFVNQCK